MKRAIGRGNVFFKVIMTSLSTLMICFIWGNSLIPGEGSGNLSLQVLNIVNTTFSSIEIKEVSHYIIRKAAHFTEHMCLGICLLVTLRAYTKNIIKNICNVLFIGLLVPVIDEFIQLFIDGRGGEIKDVIIDFSGVLTGVIVTVVIVALIDKKQKNKRRIRRSK